MLTAALFREWSGGAVTAAIDHMHHGARLPGTIPDMQAMFGKVSKHIDTQLVDNLRHLISFK